MSKCTFEQGIEPLHLRQHTGVIVWECVKMKLSISRKQQWTLPQ